MKKYTLISLFACLLLTTACENDDKLSDTRVPDKMLAMVSLSNIAVDKYDATFSIELTEKGDPEVRELGVLISTEAQPSAVNSMIIVADMSAAASSIKQTLTPGTTFYACAYALTANQMITSDVKEFKTANHPLGAFVGKKTLSGYSRYIGGDNSVEVNISLDAEDESVAYIEGLSSEAGVSLALEPVKMIFDVANGTVIIPDEQIIPEKKYGDYRFLGLDDKGKPVTGDIVGTIEDNIIKFNSLGALIVVGGNSGLFHWAYFDLAIQ